VLTLVHHGNDAHAILEHEERQEVVKALAERAPGTVVPNRREAEWTGCDLVSDPLHLGDELEPGPSRSASW